MSLALEIYWKLQIPDSSFLTVHTSQRGCFLISTVRLEELWRISWKQFRIVQWRQIYGLHSTNIALIISFTVHFIDSEFKIQSRCLQTQEVPQDHTASSLKEVLSSMFDSWKISEKVCGATTDNGQNIVNAVGLLKIEHFPCVAHTLQLSIKHGLEVTRVQRVLSRWRKLVEHFNKSTTETYKLREKQEMLKLPKHQLVQARVHNTLGKHVHIGHAC